MISHHKTVKDVALFRARRSQQQKSKLHASGRGAGSPRSPLEGFEDGVNQQIVDDVTPRVQIERLFGIWSGISREHNCIGYYDVLYTNHANFA